MPTETRWVRAPGARLHVAVDGEGPPIVLVHSALVDLRAWDALVPYLVAAGHRVVRYDVRSFGRSATEDVEFSNRADLRAVLDDLGIGRALFVGNSWGAMIALDTIIESPERAVALAWVGGGISGFDGGASPAEIPLLDEGEAAETSGDAERIVDVDLRFWVDGPGQAPTRVPAAIRNAVREMDLPMYRPDRVTGHGVPLEPSANERLGEIRIPVLAIVGALDASGTRAAATRLAGAVPNARLVIVPDVAHMVGMEVPGGLAGLILDLAGPIGAWS